MTEYQAALSDAAKKRSLDGLYEKADTLAALMRSADAMSDGRTLAFQNGRLVGWSDPGQSLMRTERLGSESSDSDLLALEAAA